MTCLNKHIEPMVNGLAKRNRIFDHPEGLPVSLNINQIDLLRPLKAFDPTQLLCQTENLTQ